MRPFLPALAALAAVTAAVVVLPPLFNKVPRALCEYRGGKYVFSLAQGGQYVCRRLPGA